MGKPGQAPGLSTFMDLELAVQPGDKPQIIDLDLLGSPLRGYEGQSGMEGAIDHHVSIAPALPDGSIDHELLAEWAATKEFRSNASTDGTDPGRPCGHRETTMMNRANERSTGYSMGSGPMPAGTNSLKTLAGGVGTAGPAPDWDALDRTAQDALSRLTAGVLAREPGAIWKAGRTATRAFPLFTYRVFYHLDGNDYDPIVVGLTFTVRDAGVRVAGDISGDESGLVYFDEACTVDVPAEPVVLQEATRAVADRLASQDSLILDAIRHRHPRAVAP